MYYTFLPLSLGDFVVNRRNFLAVCSSLGISSTLFPGALLALADEKPPVTKDMIDAAARIAGISIADDYKQAMLDSLTRQSEGFDAIYKLHIPNSVAPAIVFDPVPPGFKISTAKDPHVAANFRRARDCHQRAEKY